jgi:hypothetical protein
MENSSDKSGSLIPFTLFSSIKDNDACTRFDVTWPELTEQLTDFATVPFAKKEDAPLFTSCEFSPKHRAKANVTCSAVVILDVDGGRNPDQATLSHASRVFDEIGLAGLIYTTASHSADRHRYRVLIPLDQPVAGPVYIRAFHSLDTLFGETADLTKRGCESLFYLPGNYTGVDNQLIVFAGLTLSGGDWANMCPEVVPEVRQIAPPTNGPRSSSPKLPSYRRQNFEWASLFDCPFVTPAMIDAYRDRQHADSWYHGMYVFMCTVAGRAKLRNYQISSQELADLAVRLDQFDGGYYAHRDLEREARNAINYIF